jgi:charged multivesicular body protein 4
MSRFFRAYRAAATNPQQAVAQVRAQINQQERSIKELDAKIRGAQTEMLKYGTTNKPLALAALRRKKLYEQQREKLMGQQMNLEQMQFHVQNAEMLQGNVSAIKAGNSALKTLTQSVDDVHNVVDDLTENLAMAEEMGKALSAPVGELVDADALEKELEEFVQEEASGSNEEPRDAPIMSKDDDAFYLENDATKVAVMPLVQGPATLTRPTAVRSAMGRMEPSSSSASNSISRASGSAPVVKTMTTEDDEMRVLMREMAL